MNLREGVFLALLQIRAQKLKSFFAVIGVIIGVMFLITVVSVIEGMNKYMKEDFAGRIYGLNTLTLSRNADFNFDSDPDAWRERQRRPPMTVRDADAVRERLDVPALVAVEVSNGGNIVSEYGVEVTGVWFTGASADLFRIRDLDVSAGRVFTLPEERAGANVVILGHDAAEGLFGALDPLGRIVKLRGLPFRVIGVMEKQGTLFGQSMDNRAIAPVTSAMGKLVSQRGIVNSILVKTLEEDRLNEARMQVEAIMRVRHKLRPGADNDFNIETADEAMSFWQNIRKILLLAFPMLVSIALVVGGIVIMNIMLVSVTERTREIGIRKALGARQRDVKIQFLVEAATLSMLGAIIGIGVGMVLAEIVQRVSPLPAAIAPMWMAISVLMGTSVGIIAGLYPASKAAKLDPIVALRAE